jgi:hypothetical protein
MFKYLCLFILININLSIFAADNTNVENERNLLNAKKNAGKISNAEYLKALNELDQSTSTVEEMSRINIDKTGIRKSLESMKSAGKISNLEYMNSLKDLDNLDVNGVEALRKKAANVLDSDPKAMELLKEDPYAAQKYIEEKLKK